MNDIKSTYDSIDLMKFIACIFVVAIHSDPLVSVYAGVNYIICQGIARIAVPLFFLTSSFLLYKKGSDDKKTKRYIQRMLKLYVAWFLVELPITIYNRFIIDGYSFKISLFRFIRSFFITSTFSGSWFIVSCIFCAFFIMMLDRISNKTTKRVLVICISSFTYLLCVFTSSYGKIIDLLGLTEYWNMFEMLFSKPYTSIIVGIPYFIIGKHIAENEKNIKKPNPISVILLFIFLVIELIMVRVFHLVVTTDCLLSLLPLSLLIFIYVIKCDYSFKKPWIGSFLRRASTIVFFSQFIWLFIIEFLEYITSISLDNSIKFLFAFLLGLIATIISVRLERSKCFYWIKNFY